MCQDDLPGYTNPTLPFTVTPMASISFPIDHSRRYAVIESTPGYSVLTAVRFTDGTKQSFDASSCIKFEGGTSCAPQPLPPTQSTAKLISPLGQQIKTNIEDSLNSPAAIAARKSGTSSSPEGLAELVRLGKASRCVIATEHAGAEIYIDGLKAGITPLVLVLIKKGETPRTVEVRMAGYRTIEKHVVPDGLLITIGDKLEKQ